jgi:hypothetical protein
VEKSSHTSLSSASERFYRLAGKKPFEASEKYADLDLISAESLNPSLGSPAPNALAARPLAREQAVFGRMTQFTMRGRSMWMGIASSAQQDSFKRTSSDRETPFTPPLSG